MAGNSGQANRLYLNNGTAAPFSGVAGSDITTDAAGSIYYFVGIDGARFRRPVTPGDQLQLEVEILRISRSIGKYKALESGKV